MIEPREWLAADPDPDTRAELRALLDAGDEIGLGDRFGARLEFGTAGLRGALGAGPNRMNRVLVRQAAAGLAAHLGRGASCVVGFDARHKSHVFAQDTAAVLEAAGVRAHIFPYPVPTPVLAFAITHLGVSAGVQVTASHNPPADNGYKVYLGDGAQIVPPVDEEIAARIAAASLQPPMREGVAIVLGEEVLDAYCAGVAALDVRASTPPQRGALRIVHTAMHGVGWATAARVLGAGGFADLVPVAEQSEPDPDFPTVSFPNPEEPGALDLAFATARRERADLIIANDPDADRLALAIPDDSAVGGWRRLSGDEVGWLLASHLLDSSSALGSARLVATTIVSSTLLSSMAADCGVAYVETLTGFKWLARAALARPELTPVLAYEEALGYGVGGLVRDKDGISAALVAADFAASLKAVGRTFDDVLGELAARYGRHRTLQWSLRVDGPDPSRRMGEWMDRVRRAPPSEVAGVRVAGVRDVAREEPASDVLSLRLEDGSRVTLRPSGTEPKAKVYIETIGRDPEEVRAALAALIGTP